jgi:hypothetical protein
LPDESYASGARMGSFIFGWIVLAAEVRGEGGFQRSLSG